MLTFKEILNISIQNIPNMHINHTQQQCLLQSIGSCQHNTVTRSWGYYTEIAVCLECKAKILFINPNSSISLQKHQHRAEEWFIITGIASIIKGMQKLNLYPNETILIEQNEIHKIANKTNEELIIFEIQTGKILEETDIIRFKE